MAIQFEEKYVPGKLVTFPINNLFMFLKITLSEIHTSMLNSSLHPLIITQNFNPYLLITRKH